MKTIEKLAKLTARRIPGRHIFAAAVALLAASAFGTPLTIVSATPNSAGTELYLKFSLPLCTSSPGATHAPNYSVVGAPGVVSAATVMGDGQTVRLDLAPALAGAHTLTVVTPLGFIIYDAGCLTTSNLLVTPVSIPFNVSGTPAGPEAYWANPDVVGADCGSTVTVHGSGFDSAATLELIPASGGSSIPGSVLSVISGTTITATLPSGLTPGNYSVVIKNPSTASIFPNQSSVPFPLPVNGVKLLSNWPRFANDCAPMTVTIAGSGFCAGATVVATPHGGGTPVPGTSVHINGVGNQISATFDFSGAVQGGFDLTVQNPGGTSDTMANGIALGIPGAWQTSLPKYVGNCGTVSATFDGQFCSGDLVRLQPVSGGPEILGYSISVTATANPYWQHMSADFNLATATPGQYRVEFKRAGGDWVQASYYTFVMDSGACPIVMEFVGRTRVGISKVNHFKVNVYNVSCGSLSPDVTVSFPASDNPNFSNPLAGGVTGGTISSSPANTISYSIASLAVGQIYPLEFDLNLPNVDTTATLTANGSSCGMMTQLIDVRASQDPNAKNGLAGNGAQHVIVGNEDLPYEIHFENMATASAPAQDIFITDHLNPAQFDLSTFSLGEITFGEHTITPPPGLTSYSETVAHDMDGDPATTTDQMLLVVKAALVTDASSADYGRITWSYRTLDLVTLDTPADVMLGFLPPNKLSPMGEGSVKFNVKLKPGIAAGTQMGSAAVIVFDANAPLSTNPWFNQLASPIPLVIRRVGSAVQVEWTAPAGLFTLEQSTQLGAGAAWTTVSTTPVTVGSLQRVTIPATGAQKYFRLRL